MSEARGRRNNGARTVAAVLVGLLLVLAHPFAARAAPSVAELAAAVETALAAKSYADAEAIAAAGLALARETLGEDDPATANLHRLHGDTLFYQGRYAEAEPDYRQAFETRRRRLGDGAIDTAVSANDLGIILNRLQRYGEAEPYYRRAAAIREAVEGENAPGTARAYFWLARILDAQNKQAEAAATMATAVARATIAFGARDPQTVQWAGERAAMLHDAGDLDAAEPAYLAAIAAAQAVFEPGDMRLAADRQGLANLYMSTSRPAAAVPLYRASLSAREAALGADDPATLSSAYRLGRALYATDDIVGAEPLFRRVLAARQAASASPADVADVLRWIGRAAAAQDRQAEAETVFRQVLEISNSIGPEDVLTGFDLIALGQLYSGQQRFDEARPLLARAVDLLDVEGGDPATAGAARMALSFLEHAAGNTPRAIELAEAARRAVAARRGADSPESAGIGLALAGYRHDAGDLVGADADASSALAILRAAAPDGRDTIRALSELGRIRADEGRTAEALSLHREALDALTARYGAESSETGIAYADYGRSLFATGDYAGAAAAFERGVAIAERLAAIDAVAAFVTRTGDVEDQAIARAAMFDALVKSYDRLGASDPIRAGDLAGRAFVVAQRVIESRAAAALAQMAQRQAAGSGALAALVRQRQDLVAAWRRSDGRLTVALGDPAAGTAAIADLRTALAGLDARIARIDASLAADFPGFAALQRPAPLTLAEVQAGLGENDVLLFFADTGALGSAPGETYLWAVPKSGAPVWRRLAQTPAALAAAVRELRGALGAGADARGPTAVAQRTGSDRTSRVLAAASALQAVLLGDIADLISGHDLVVVPSRALAALPFEALVTALPPKDAADRFAATGWLLRDHAITMLPSVSALRLVRAAQTPAVADRSAYLAFANPLLTGAAGSDRRAFARTGCAEPAVTGSEAPATGVPPVAALMRGGAPDVAAVRRLPPLPETTDEVCAIAALLGAPAAALHLGADATETRLRALSDAGELMRPRIVHFATHGLVSGDLSDLAEPAIVLSPPDRAGTTGDDGLLTASEIAGLRLDADWVILSACNTAAGDGSGEALSGLARAFFYAGARALLVSHWPVNSAAAVRLTTGALAAIAADPRIGRAQALRRAMLAEIDRGGFAADPVSWAPFALVGASR